MHAQYKIPASIYIHFRSRTTRFLPRALSLRSFFSFLFFFLSCFPLLPFIDSPRVLSTVNRLIFLLRFSLSRAQTFDTVLWNGALSVPYTIPHRDLCAYRTQENTDCHLRNASPLYLYRRCINFYKKIDRANINFTIEWKTMFAV